MHLGNIYAALMSWLSVRERGGKWLLRIEDLDTGRSRPEYMRLIEDDLLWLGLEWDEGGLGDRGVNGPYRQSLRSDIYAECLEKLRQTGMVYPCTCRRADLLATNAPHQSDGRVIYPGRCRPAVMPCYNPVIPQQPHAWRLAVPNETIEFTDRNYGRQRYNLAHDCGDFIVRRADGAWAYQLAVVADDALMDVTEVVRGEDLLLSAAQQIYLYRLFGWTPPEYAHIPLICNEAGQRLSKRDKSMDMEALRAHHSPETLRGELARLAGLQPDAAPITLPALLTLYENR